MPTDLVADGVAPLEGLNSPYGGTLVRQVVSMAQAAPARTTFSVSHAIESDLFNLALGTFSPLTGFMDSSDFAAVCARRRLARSDLPWTVPIVFDIDDAERRQVTPGSVVYLQSARTGRLIGLITATDVYIHDREARIAATFGVDSDDHPGVRETRRTKDFLLGGAVAVFAEALPHEPLAYPAAVRSRLEAMGLSRVAGFHTRNVVHRAHEYLQRVALELTGGLLIQPIIGWKKSGDFRTEVIRRTYERFIAAYYPPDRVLLAFLDTPTRYGGPQEAVLHAIVRKNFGCSHFVVGRDHAGVGDFYGTYAAHRIFDTLPPLGIEILRLREPFYCGRCEGLATELTCGHGPEARSHISGSHVRHLLGEGSDPSHHVLRPEVLEILRTTTEALFHE